MSRHYEWPGAEEPLYMYARCKIEKNRNLIVLVCGSTGSGKSWACLDLGVRFSEMFGSNFSVKDNVAFEFKDFLKNTVKEENKKPGTVFVFEEVGAMGGGGSAREWQSKANKMFFTFLQTSRHRNQILILNTPITGFLEKGARSLIHVHITMEQINVRLGKSKGRTYVLQTDPRMGKIYFKKFKLANKQGIVIESPYHVFSKPPKQIREDYEAMKTAFTTRIYDSMLKDEGKPARKTRITDEQLLLLDKKNFNHTEMSKALLIDRKTVIDRMKKLKSVAL